MTPTDDPPDSGRPGGPEDEDRPVTTEDLIALRDGDLDDDQARRVRERIERDPEAVAGLLDELDQTDAILDRIRSQPVPPELSARLEAAIADERARDQPPDDRQPGGGREDGDPGP